MHSVVFFFCSLNCFSPPSSILNYAMHYKLLLSFDTFACCFMGSFSLFPAFRNVLWYFLSHVSSGGLNFLCFSIAEVLLHVTHSCPYSQCLRILFVINLCLDLLPMITEKCLFSLAHNLSDLHYVSEPEVSPKQCHCPSVKC